MASFQDLMVSTLLFALIAVALISFGAQMAIDNEANSTILQDPNINATLINLTTSLESSQGIAENQSKSQDENLPVALFDFLFESIIGSVRIFKAQITVIYNLTLGLLISKVGLPIVVLATFSAIILIVIIFRAWRNFKTGT